MMDLNDNWYKKMEHNTESRSIILLMRIILRHRLKCSSNDPIRFWEFTISMASRSRKNKQWTMIIEIKMPELHSRL